jgi:ATP-dependent RNA helicase DHX57
MTLLKRQLSSFPAMRLIIMSATMQEGCFGAYFNSPVVYVQGRTHPVTDHFQSEIHDFLAKAQKSSSKSGGAGAAMSMGKKALVNGGGKARAIASTSVGPTSLALRQPKFDPDMVAELVVRIIQTYSSRRRVESISAATAVAVAGGSEAGPSSPGTGTGDAILVFLSGIQAIEKVNRILRQRGLASMNAQVHILHGSLSPEMQRRVFRRTKPGEWKVVLSTNIAETSVTVEDVTHVVDCGLVKELQYDPEGFVAATCRTGRTSPPRSLLENVSARIFQWGKSDGLSTARNQKSAS